MDTFLKLASLFVRRWLTEKKRRKYAQEFKEETVKLITEQRYQITGAARNHGVNENMLGRWKRQIEGVGENAPGLKGGTAMLTELNHQQQPSFLSGLSQPKRI